jgi:hypothetical protein
MVVSGCPSSTQFSIEIEININLFISVYSYLQLFLFCDFDFAMRFAIELHGVLLKEASVRFLHSYTLPHRMTVSFFYYFKLLHRQDITRRHVVAQKVSLTGLQTVDKISSVMNIRA